MLKTTAAPGNWNSTTVWGGPAPTAADEAVVAHAVTLNANAAVAKLTIAPAANLTFKPDANITLTATGNVIVEGILTIRPSSTKKHTVKFDGINEAAFVGGGHAVLDTDVGLWCHGGTLDIKGTAKTAWSRATTPLLAGATTVKLALADAWKVGDRLAIVPTGPPSMDEGKFHVDVDHCLTYDEVTVTARDGKLVTFTPPLAHDHPMVTFADWTGATKTYGAEVLNLTRNVLITGTPTGRTHIGLFHLNGPVTISNVEIAHMGPRRVIPENLTKTRSVLGRYGIHFHQNGDATRGSVLDGVVVHDCGGHSFVPHDSHGITLRNCIAHNVRGDAFWWDQHERDADYHPATHDSLWENCVASKVWADKTSEGEERYRMAGFVLTEGDNDTNVCVGCVAVGIYDLPEVDMNSSMVSGFHWPEAGRAVWGFRDCLAHNVAGAGIFTWQNDAHVHLLERFTAYHCGKSGVDHGAYSNFWHYRDMALFANRRAGFAIHAVTRRTDHLEPDPPNLRLERIVVDGAGLTRWGIHAEGHRFRAEDDGPTDIIAAKVSGCWGASYYEGENNNNRSLNHLTDCTFAAPEFYFEENIPADTMVVASNLNGSGSTFTLRQMDQAGELVPAWNASRS